jgi:AraC family transcriptional regulator
VDTPRAPGVGGSIVQRLQLEHFVLYESVYARARTPVHTHGRPIIAFAVDGRFVTTVERDVWYSEAPSLLLVPEGAPHSEYFESTSRCLLIEVDHLHFAELPEVKRALGLPVAFARGSAPSIIARQLRDELAGGLGPTRLVAEGHLLRLLAAVSRGKGAEGGAPPRSVRRAQEFLHDTFLSAVSMTDVARAVGIHPTSLCRAFARHLRVSPGEYQRRLRLEWARDRLARSTLPIGRIAAEAGFADHAHFSRSFREAYGMTPSQYRASCRRPKLAGPLEDQSHLAIGEPAAIVQRHLPRQRAE